MVTAVPPVGVIVIVPEYGVGDAASPVGSTVTGSVVVVEPCAVLALLMPLTLSQVELVVYENDTGAAPEALEMVMDCAAGAEVPACDVKVRPVVELSVVPAELVTVTVPPVPVPTVRLTGRV